MSPGLGNVLKNHQVSFNSQCPYFWFSKLLIIMSPAGLVLLKLSAAFDSMGYPNVNLYGIICFTPLIFLINRGENTEFFLEIFAENLWIIKRWVDIVFWHVWIIGKGFCSNKTVWLCPLFKCEFAKAGYIIGACRTLLCWLMILFFCAHIFRSEIINLSIIIDKFEKYFRM